MFYLTKMLVLVFLVVGILAGVLVILLALVGLKKLMGEGKGAEPLERNKFGLWQYHDSTKYDCQPALTKRKDNGKRPEKKSTGPIEPTLRPALVLTFDGDLRASKRKPFAKLIDEVLINKDEISEAIVIMNSPGGTIAEYGLLYAEMERVRSAGIRLTACIDTAAASGGYLMSLPSNKIISAPFAWIGSVGVVAYVPNIHRWLVKHDIDPRLFTAGQLKRTVTLIGDDGEEAKRHFQAQLENIQRSFIGAVKKYRPSADFDKVQTGDHWTAEESMAQNLGLVDEISTSQQYLLDVNAERDLVLIGQKSKPWEEGLGRVMSMAFDSIAERVISIVSSHQV